MSRYARFNENISKDDTYIARTQHHNFDDNKGHNSIKQEAIVTVLAHPQAMGSKYASFDGNISKDNSEIAQRRTHG